jgi:hypothetical protein
MIKRNSPSKNRHALSPIFATILLASIIILFGSVAYYFSSNIAKTSTDNYVSTISDSQQAISESVGFENVIYTNSNPATLAVYILNCGIANNLKINSVFIYNSTRSIIGSPYSGSQISSLVSIVGGSPIVGNCLNVGQEGYFTITSSSLTLVSGSTYTIRLITQAGSNFDYDFVP